MLVLYKKSIILKTFDRFFFFSLLKGYILHVVAKTSCRYLTSCKTFAATQYINKMILHVLANWLTLPLVVPNFYPFI